MFLIDLVMFLFDLIMFLMNLIMLFDGFGYVFDGFIHFIARNSTHCKYFNDLKLSKKEKATKTVKLYA